MNTSYSLKPDTTLNIANIVQDIPITLDNMSPITTPTMPPITNPNIQAMSSHSNSLKTAEFFYTPYNDFQMYHIICKEVPLTFQSFSQLIINTDNNVHSNIFIFYLRQPKIEKIYEITCKMVSHTLISQFLNKNIYNIQSVQSEYQQQEFSVKHRENLKFHLKRDLIHYLTSKNAYEDNYHYNLHEKFIQDYRDCESTIMNSTNTDTFNKSQQYNENTFPFNQSFTSQQDNNYQNYLVYDTNNGHNDNYYQDCYNNQPY